VPTVSLTTALRLLIQESGLSKRCIARRAGVHYEIVLRFMRGERAVSMATADKILAALKVTCRLEKEAKT
jgi:plasmid maintenance system antidote protein VapI